MTGELYSRTNSPGEFEGTDMPYVLGDEWLALDKVHTDSTIDFGYDPVGITPVDDFMTRLSEQGHTQLTAIRDSREPVEALVTKKGNLELGLGTDF